MFGQAYQRGGQQNSWSLKATWTCSFVSDLLSNGLPPFIRRNFPDGHRFQQNDNLKHTSRLATNFMEDYRINWWKTPSESPDLNPIDMLWHERKHFLRNIIKPRTKEELINGIERFWNERMDAEKCTKYIRHLHKVLPIVVEQQGKPSRN